MKVFHIADLHLGLNLTVFDRQAEQEHFLEFLTQTLFENKADVLLIAGDVFDTQNPSAQAQKLFFRFLKKLKDKIPSIQVVIIAGNHDSATRLEAPKPFLEENGLYLVGEVRRKENKEVDLDAFIKVLEGKNGEKISCVAVPYIKNGELGSEISYEESLKNLYYTLNERAKSYGFPVFMLGHLYVNGSEIMEEGQRSERIIIGSAQSVSHEIFPEDIAYCALGHLHKSQKVGGRENVRYSGSCICMSFAEKDYKFGVNMISSNQDGSWSVERIAYEPLCKFVSLPISLPKHEYGTLSQILEEIRANFEDGEAKEDSPYVEIRLKQLRPEPSAKQEIEQLVKTKRLRLVKILSQYAGEVGSEEEKSEFKELREFSPLEIAKKEYKRKFSESEEMPQEMENILNEILREYHEDTEN